MLQLFHVEQGFSIGSGVLHHCEDAVGALGQGEACEWLGPGLGCGNRSKDEGEGSEIGGEVQGERHVVDGAEGDSVKTLHVEEGFGARGVHLSGEVEGANHFAEEGGLFTLRLGEGNGEVWAEDVEGEAGKAGAGAEVQDGVDVLRKMGREEQAFTEVTGDDGLRLVDSGEVGAGVPFEKVVEVGAELTEESGGGWGVDLAEEGGEECGDAIGGQSGHAA